VSHDKSPLEQALDLAVFGPLGLALTAKDALPGWVDKGRRRIFHQVEVAKMVGEHASQHGQKVVTGTLVGLGILPGPPPSPQRATAGSAPDAGAGAGERDRTGAGAADGDGAAATGGGGVGVQSNGGHVQPRFRAMTSNGRASPEPATVAAGAVPPSADLAIPGYDSLSAPQVVQRLAGLAAPELEAVQTYEAANRGRRTILTKISQLQAGRT
jgi:hypothetical protein